MLVHLIRHPVYFAYSMATHGFYSLLRRDDVIKFTQLDPFDPGIVQKEYRHRWEKMTPYEKALFFWTEVNLYALELNSRFTDIPFFQVKMEDLINLESKSLREFVSFLGLPFYKELVESKNVKKDIYSRKTALDIDWRTVFQHPQTIHLAKSFGYTFDNIDGEQLKSRYKQSWIAKFIDGSRRAKKRIFANLKICKFYLR